MKKSIAFFFLLLSTLAFSQPVTFINNRCYGGTGNEERCFGTIELSQGFLLTGKTNSNNDNVTDFHGVEDGWLVNTDLSGNVLWTHAYGNGDYEGLFSSIKTSDGNLVSVGYSSSVGGQVTSNAGMADYWVIKTDLSGNIIWQKSYGGSKNDVAYSVVEMPDSTYLIGGLSNSLDGDVVGHHGNFSFSDAWLIRVNKNNGNIIWKRSYGGAGNEGSLTNFSDFQPLNIVTPKEGDTTFSFTCATSSADGDVLSNPTGSLSYWLVKAGESGTIIFEKSYGGTNNDISYNLAITNDGGFLVVGGSASNDGDVTGHSGTVGTYDDWIVKTDSVGTIQWQLSMGGTNEEDAFGIAEVPLGYYVLGRNYSFNLGCSGAGYHGGSDYYLLLLDTTGLVKWKRCFGGSGYEEGYTILRATNGDMVCTGHAGSSDGDVMFQHGGFDFWMVSFADISSVEEINSENKLVVWPNPGNELLNIYLGENFHHGQLSIYDMEGSLIKNIDVENSSTEISVADLDAGVYELILSDENGKRTHSSWVKY
jgi:hypothetical protein